jgi:HPr kinase/phosphorylase
VAANRRASHAPDDLLDISRRREPSTWSRGINLTKLLFAGVPRLRMSALACEIDRMDENEHAARGGRGASRATDPSATAPRDETIHAGAVGFAGSGILILGPSGSGKSGLALRLAALGADIVADDRVLLRRDGHRLLAAPPAALAGLVEARGVGVLRLPDMPVPVAVGLAVDLGRPAAARMPPRRKIVLLGIEIALISGRDVPNLDAVITVLVHRGGVVI